MGTLHLSDDFSVDEQELAGIVARMLNASGGMLGGLGISEAGVYVGVCDALRDMVRTASTEAVVLNLDGPDGVVRLSDGGKALDFAMKVGRLRSQ